MATYFDYSDSDDTALLHSYVRTHTELEQVANEVEYEIIEMYTFPTPTQPYIENFGDTYFSDEKPYYHTTSDHIVWLNGYRPDADDTLTNPLLKEAMRRTIAKVVSHRLLHYDYWARIKREKRGRREVEYETQNDKMWPDAWDALLVAFDLRPSFSF